MNKSDVTTFKEAAARVDCHMDFNQFCKTTGFMGDYAMAKWRLLGELNSALSQFDAGTLAHILSWNPERILSRNQE